MDFFFAIIFPVFMIYLIIGNSIKKEYKGDFYEGTNLRSIKEYS